MGINCSEKCIYSSDGMCTLSHVTNSTGKILNNCPYFRPNEVNQEKAGYQLPFDSYHVKE